MEGDTLPTASHRLLRSSIERSEAKVKTERGEEKSCVSEGFKSLLSVRFNVRRLGASVCDRCISVGSKSLALLFVSSNTLICGRRKQAKG